MVRLIPFLLILLMVSRKGNYFNEEDIELFAGVPSEYLKTNTFWRKPFPLKNKIINIKEPYLVHLQRRISEELLERMKRSEVAFLVQLEEDEEEEFREFFVN